MSYRAQHARPASRLKLGLVVGVAAFGTALSGVALTAGSASAAVPTVPMISNGTPGPGEAGYFVNDNGQTRIRDVQLTTTVTAQMENLNGTSPAEPGGIGAELCNDNTGWAAQVGLVWNGTSFQAEYNYSGNASFDTTLSTTNGPGDILLANPAQDDQDPCVEAGLLNSGNGAPFTNFLNSTPVTATNAIHVGDSLFFEIYYNPKGKHNHQLTFKVRDITRNISREQTVNVPAQNLYEAGIGVVSQNTTLTGGAVNLINTFTSTSFNWYGNKSTPVGSVLSSRWDTEEADFINGSSQVTLTPGPLNSVGTSFQMLEGSTSS